MSVKTVSLLQYLGINIDEVGNNTQNLLNKAYADKCYYPFQSPTILYTPTNGYFNIAPSIEHSFWVIRNFGNVNGEIVIQAPNNEESNVFTFELMIIKGMNDTGTITFSDNISWLGETPEGIETNKIYFFVFRTVYVDERWVIIGNNQGCVSL